jgi:nitrogen-specific signal transduction histidine kinase
MPVRRFHSRIMLLVIVAVLAWIFLLHSHSLVRRLRETSQTANETIAWFWAGTQVPLSILADNATMGVCSECGYTERIVSEPSDSLFLYCPECRHSNRWYAVSRWNPEENEMVLQATRQLFRTLVERIDYPTVFSDFEMFPQVVNGEVVPDDVAPHVLRRYLQLQSDLAAENRPIPIIENADTIGYLHYGSNSIFSELVLMPYLELGILVVLALIFYLGVRSELRREKETSWVGFAKETAHQISTPLSSLMGWIELLRDSRSSSVDPELEEALDSIELDVNRLNQIARRYGQMGKKPVLSSISVNSVIEETITYFRSRPGILHKRVEIETHLEAEGYIMGNEVLLGWVFENMLKNSLASLSDTRGGLITISTSDLEEGHGGTVQIIVSDSGCGIPFRDQNRVFQPGFTTRRGGWGLGLTLSRRIVEEYHNGRIRLASSVTGRGTTFTIQFPRKEPDS